LLDGCHQSDKDIVDEVDLIIGILIGADQERSVRCRSITDFRWSVVCAIELSSSWMSSSGAPMRLGEPFWLATDWGAEWLTSIHIVGDAGLAIRKDPGQIWGSNPTNPTNQRRVCYCFRRPQYF
jgi:hypothetical protein